VREAEESPLVEAVATKRLVKTLQGIAIVESCYRAVSGEGRPRRLSVE
jgi:hypothetical protein